MICYPMGLPEWDFVRMALEDREELAGTSWANDDLAVEQTAMWFAGEWGERVEHEEIKHKIVALSSHYGDFKAFI